MAASMRRVLWDPHGGDTFLTCGNTDVKLQRWKPEARAEQERRGNVQTLASCTDLPMIRALAWSPEPRYDDLVAVGLSSGRTLLIRMGEAISTDPAEAQPHSSLPFTAFALNARMPRPCNAVAFSPVMPRHLAIGLDKAREPALQVYDIETAASALDRRSARHGNGFGATLARRGNGMESPSREPETRTIFSAAASETVQSAAWLSLGGASATSPQLLAGMSTKSVRAYDVRIRANDASPAASSTASTASAAIAFNTRATLGVVADPFNAFRWASYGDEGQIKIWDMRRSTDSLLTFSDGDAWHRLEPGSRRSTGALAGLAFSPLRPGAFASLEVNSSCVRLWDLYNGVAEQPDIESSAGSVSSLSSGPPMHWPVLAGDRVSPPFSRPPLAFAFVNARSRPRSTHSFISLSREGVVELVHVRDPTVHASNASNDLVLAANDVLRLSSLEGHPPSSSEARHEISTSLQLPDGGDPPRPGLTRGLSSRSVLTTGQLTPRARQRTASVTNTDFLSERDGDESIFDFVTRDISTVMRARALRGYASDPERNAKITQDALSNLWTWLGHADLQQKQKHALVDGYDLAYRGVCDLIAGFAPVVLPAPVARPTDRATPAVNRLAAVHEGSSGNSSPPIDPGVMRRRRQNEQDAAQHAFNRAIEAHVHRIGATAFIRTSQTVKLARRRLALIAAQPDFATADAAEIVRLCEGEDQPERAAAWAVFCGKADLASAVLARAKDEQLKIYAHTLRMYEAESSAGRVSVAFGQLCSSLSGQAHSPYAAAMFAYLASGDWSDVIESINLPLRDRLGIALRFVSDDKLEAWLERLKREAIKDADLEGIVLTGLTSDGFALLQRYVDKTGDVQTAALVASFVHPGRLSNARAERWVASYRKLLDAWQLYIHRARFDVARGSRTRFAQQALRDAGADVEPIDLAPARVLLRCHFCGTVAAPTPGGATPNLPTGPPALRHRPTACAQCKKSFPRCSICLTAIAVLPELDTLERPTSYTWCQKCRHGGHADHLLGWFRRNSTCPVATCDCACQA